mgnify:CR=1 FL=1
MLEQKDLLQKQIDKFNNYLKEKHNLKLFAFEYDLSSEWKKLTGLPFAFAVWVSKEKIEEL